MQAAADGGRLEGAADEGVILGVVREPEEEDVDRRPFRHLRIAHQAHDLGPAEPRVDGSDQGVGGARDLGEREGADARVRVVVARGEEDEARSVVGLRVPGRCGGEDRLHGDPKLGRGVGEAGPAVRVAGEKHRGFGIGGKAAAGRAVDEAGDGRARGVALHRDDGGEGEGLLRVLAGEDGGLGLDHLVSHCALGQGDADEAGRRRLGGKGEEGGGREDDPAHQSGLYQFGEV